MSHIQSIVYKPKGSRNRKDAYTRVPLDAATLVAGYGIEGDRKGGSPKRQLNLMSASTVAALAAEGYQTAPGQLGEQIVIAGVELETLPAGTVLHIGDAARVELIKSRTGCERFEHIQEGRRSHSGRLGVLARVTVSGAIKVGDAVRVEIAEGAPALQPG